MDIMNPACKKEDCLLGQLNDTYQLTSTSEWEYFTHYDPGDAPDNNNNMRMTTTTITTKACLPYRNTGTSDKYAH